MKIDPIKKVTTYVQVLVAFLLVLCSCSSDTSNKKPNDLHKSKVEGDQSLLKNGYQLLLNNQVDEAIESLNQYYIETNDPETLYYLSRAYQNKKNHELVYSTAQKGRGQGVNACSYYLGNLYRAGRHVEKDTAAAANHYKLAAPALLERADSGCAVSQTDLAYLIRQGLAPSPTKASVRGLLEKAMQQGYLKAYTDLGRCYKSGNFVRQDYQKAFSLFKYAAERGYSSGQYMLFLAYFNGEGVDTSSTKALKWLNQSAKSGHSQAQAFLGYFYQVGYGSIKPDLKKSVTWYKKAIAQGYKTAQYTLGKLLIEKRLDPKEGLMWMEKSANQGDTDAFRYLGYAFNSGEYIEINKKKSFDWYRKGAELGQAECQANLAFFYGKGEVVDQNHYLAFEWSKKAAKNGSALGQYNLSVSYSKGKAVEVDHDKANYWLKKAADNGNAKAQYEMYTRHVNGKNQLDKDDIAIDYLEKAAINGFQEAQLMIAILYKEGFEVEQNLKKSFKFFERAALQGNGVAQFNLADFYLTGEVVKEDIPKALYWLELSVDNKVPGAEELYANIKEIYSKMKKHGLK